VHEAEIESGSWRVTQWRRGEKTSKEFAAETGVSASTLPWWSTKLSGERDVRRGAGSAQRQSRRVGEALAELPIVELSGGVGDERFEIELDSARRLRIPAGFDAEALGRLLAVLKRSGPGCGSSCRLLRWSGEGHQRLRQCPCASGPPG